MVLQTKKQKQFFFCGHNILTEGVFVTLLSSSTEISDELCVGKDKLLFHKRCVIYMQPLFIRK